MDFATDPRRGGGRALALVCLAAVIEGFDLQSAGVALPKLAPAFGLGPQQISGCSSPRRPSGSSSGP